MKRVVITGIGAVTPIGNTAEETWKNMVDGKCGIGQITRFDTSDYKVKLAAEVKDFDPLQYMEKSEARKEDLYSQYAVAAAIQAVEDSEVNTENTDPYRFGVYVGSGTGGMTTFSEEHGKLLERGPRKVSPFFVPMMISNMAAGNIAIRFGCKGATLPVVTACATSTNAVGEAYRAVKHGYADVIIAGGAEATIVPLAVAGFTNCQALSLTENPEEASIPFDARRNGFVMGEGAGMLILEEYEHAVSRGAKIYAEIKGYGNTCDAYHMTAPDPEAESSGHAVKLAFEEAGYFEGELSPESVYINAHGTSTPLNDKTETAAIKKAFGEAEAKKLHVSSTKSMTGHMLGAAGAVEAIAAVKAIEEGIVPPTIGYKEADPECDLDITPNKAVKADIKMSASISLGFGGHNGCVVFGAVEK